MRGVLIGGVVLLAGCVDPPPDAEVCGAGLIDDDGVCVPEECGRGPFGVGTEEAIFVAPSPRGTDGGAGTADDPLARIGPAVDLAFTSGVGAVRLADGQYLGSVSFGRTADGVRVTGRCPALTILDGGGLAGATVTVHADGVQLAGMTVTGGAPGIAVLPSDEDGSARLAASDLEIVDNGFAGLVVAGNPEVEADLRDSSITGTAPRAEGADAHALLVEGGARLGAVGVEIQSNTGVGVGARGAVSIAELDDVRVVRLDPFPDGRPATALRASGGAAIVATQFFSSATVGVGVRVSDDGSLVQLDDAVVRDTTPTPSGAGGHSVVATAGGRAVLRDGTALRASGTALVAEDGAQIQFEAWSANQVVSRDPRYGAVGLRVGEGAIASGDGLSLLTGAGPGVVVDAGGEFHCTDCEIRSREFAGIVAQPASTVRLTQGSVTLGRASEALRGGVGILGFGDGVAGPTIEILGTSLADHAGPAVLLQGGPATVLVSGASIERSGSGGGDLPRAGLVARDGVGRWSGVVGEPDATGLWVRQCLFRDLGGDAILLHAATATVDTNTFEDVGEAALRVQSCAGLTAPEIVGPAPTTVLCEEPRDMGDLLRYPGI